MLYKLLGFLYFQNTLNQIFCFEKTQNIQFYQE